MAKYQVKVNGAVVIDTDSKAGAYLRQQIELAVSKHTKPDDPRHGRQVAVVDAGVETILTGEIK